METEATQIISQSGGIGSIIAIVLLGAFSAFSIWDRFFSQRSKEKDAADDRLITILQETVKTLETKVAAFEGEQKETAKMIATLQGENSTLKVVLQGKDADSVDYRKRGLEAMEQTKQILAVTIPMAANVTQLVELMRQSIKK